MDGVRAILLLVTLLNLVGVYLSWRSRKQLQTRLVELSEPRMKHDISLQIHDGLIVRMGLSCDLIERAITDLTFLHGQVYSGSAKDHCPICASTVPELEDMRVRLQTVRVDIREGRS